jgi:hypothetical protein
VWESCNKKTGEPEMDICFHWKTLPLNSIIPYCEAVQLGVYCFKIVDSAHFERTNEMHLTVHMPLWSPYSMFVHDNAIIKEYIPSLRRFY